jgi:hypothetical protein
MKVQHKNGVSSRQTGAQPQVDTERLPVDAATGQPIMPRARPGYYPGFST